MTNYNGWTNWETWNTALHFDGAEMTGEEIKDFLENEVENVEFGLLKCFLYDAIQKINFDELDEK